MKSGNGALMGQKNTVAGVTANRSFVSGKTVDETRMECDRRFHDALVGKNRKLSLAIFLLIRFK